MSKYSDYMFQKHTKMFIELEKFIEPTPIQQAVIPMACKGRYYRYFSDRDREDTRFFDSYYGK